jgi:hypothetical protein
VTVTALTVQYPDPATLAAADVRAIKRLRRSYGLCADCGVLHAPTAECPLFGPEHRLDKYSRYNASEKGRERVDRYRLTGAGSLMRALESIRSDAKRRGCR